MWPWAAGSSGSTYAKSPADALDEHLSGPNTASAHCRSPQASGSLPARRGAQPHAVVSRHQRRPAPRRLDAEAQRLAERPVQPSAPLRAPTNGVTVPQARAEARKLIAAFLETVKNDNGPRTPGRPMDAFAAEFLELQARHWKPRPLESNAYMVRKYILPAFGHITADAITVEHVKDWFASMAERPGSANRAMPK